MILRPFNSFKEYIDYAETPHPNDVVTGWQNSSERINPEFSGVSTKGEAFTLCRGGHVEGTRAMEKVLASLKNAITLPCEQYQFLPSVEGSAPDVEAYIQGIPEDMLFMEPIQSEAAPTYLRVQMELSYASNIEIAQVRLAGAVIFAAQEALKMQGCNLELILTSTGGEVQFSFPIPSHIDLDTFAFIYTHPAMLRIIGFSACEHESKAIRQANGYYQNGGYGRITEHRLPNMDAFLALGTICMQVRNLESAKTVFNTLVSNKFKHGSFNSRP